MLNISHKGGYLKDDISDFFGALNDLLFFGLKKRREQKRKK